MAHFGIDISRVYSMRVLNSCKQAKHVGKNQELSLLRWGIGFDEERLLATFIGDYNEVAAVQINA